MKIVRPTLLVDREKCTRNIQRMAEKALRSNAPLRPHFKTHHSAHIGEWFRSLGVNKCTVSSVSMAEYFANHGWKDITIAFPYNPLESEAISSLALEVSLNVLLESAEAQQMANDLLTQKVGFFIKIDVGTHRTGIDPTATDLIKQLVANSSEKVVFKGFLAHAGHTYKLHHKEEITQIFDQCVESLLPLQDQFGGIISYGDTPSCSLVEDLSAFDEIRAGNFVFYDWMQHDIGSCTVEDIAVCMMCPVVAIHPERNEVVLYGGGVHLSKDFIEEDGIRSYGKAVSANYSGWSTEVIGNVVRLSQEHGIIQMSDDQMAHLKIGDLIGVIPVHSCLAADLQGHYFTTSGEKIEKIVKE